MGIGQAEILQNEIEIVVTLDGGPGRMQRIRVDKLNGTHIAAERSNMGPNCAMRYKIVQCGNLFVAPHKMDLQYPVAGSQDLPMQAQQQV